LRGRRNLTIARQGTGVQTEARIAALRERVRPMDVRIKNGTPMHGESLCETCVHAHLVKGFRESEQLVVCQACYPERTVPFRVRECSGYTQVKRQTLKQMEEIAWVLDPKGNKRRAGFVPASELRKDEEAIEIVLRHGASEQG
jgi:hypothetical protein